MAELRVTGALAFRGTSQDCPQPAAAPAGCSAQTGPPVLALRSPPGTLHQGCHDGEPVGTRSVHAPVGVTHLQLHKGVIGGVQDRQGSQEERREHGLLRQRFPLVCSEPAGRRTGRGPSQVACVQSPRPPYGLWQWLGRGSQEPRGGAGQGQGWAASSALGWHRAGQTSAGSFCPSPGCRF